MKKIFLILFVCVIISCQSGEESEVTLHRLAVPLEYIDGKSEYLESPYVTAGSRLYMVGHQDGTFPDLGWHVKDEMGGIWDHPIKLLDGFAASLIDKSSGDVYCLDQAESFRNYPFAGQHRYQWEEKDIAISRLQFVPDDVEGLVVEYEIRNDGESSLELDMDFIAQFDLRPVWLGERTGMEDHADLVEYDQEADVLIARDSVNSWFSVVGSGVSSTGPVEEVSCKSERVGLGVDAGLSYSLSIPAGGVKSLSFTITGSYNSQEEAIATYEQISGSYIEMFREKKQKYSTIRKRADLEIPDKDVQEMYTWTKYANDWLTKEIPGMGRGITAGIPDYPWMFGLDHAYTIQAILCAGEHQLAKEAIEMMFELSEKENGNGRMIHEVSTNGAVYNPGLVIETPIMISTVWEYYLWTGDKELLEKLYPLIQSGLEWLMEQDRDGNMYPDGYGAVEIHGLDAEMIDVIAYTQQAFQDAASVAEVLGDSAKFDEYSNIAEELLGRINNDWWVESMGSFADFRASKQKSLELIDEAIERADTLGKPWSVKDLRQVRDQIVNSDEGLSAWAFYHNWVVMTPMSLGIAEEEKALKALETARKYTNRFGAYVTGIDREEESGDEGSFADSKSKQEFNYVGAVMTLPTGVQAVAESTYGNTEEAFELIQKLRNSFSYAAPGSIYEVSPDYGMLVQAWNLYGMSVPIVKHFFGIKPEAGSQKITIEPDFPQDWIKANLNDLPVGDRYLTYAKFDSGPSTYYSFNMSEDGWTINLILPQTESLILVNGQEADPAVLDNPPRLLLELKGNNFEIEVRTPESNP